MSLAFVCLWTSGDIMDVSLFGIFMYLILMKAQQERAFLCLLLQLRMRTAQRRKFLIQSFYQSPPLPQTIRIWMRVHRLLGERGVM